MPRTTVLFILALLFAVAADAATAPARIDYQGVLRDANDQPLDGSYDMTFRFFDLLAGGNEILVDAHTGANAVVVEGGLFAVHLGGGVVSDGAAALPGDPYDLPAVFRDFDSVWLEIQIGAETLSPRTRIVSAAYAQNAAALGGRSADEFIDTSATDQTKTGKLTAGGIDVQGNLRLIDNFFQSIYFADGGDPQAEAFRWDQADHLFEATAGLQLDGPLVVGDPSLFPVGYNRFGTDNNPQSGNIGGGQDLFIGDDVEAAGEAWFGSDLEVGGIARFNGQIVVDDDGPDADQRVRFWNNGGINEELKWDEAGDRFEFSDALALAGSLRTGNTQANPEGFNHLGNLGKTPDSDDMSGTQDLYVEGDVEIEEILYLGSQLVMLDRSSDDTDRDQWIFFYDGGEMDAEYIKWDNSSGTGGATDRFEMSDSLHVYGDLTALNKNFVQNYPGRDDLEIVYTTLEGDEATVFTRGHGRLTGGEARVALGETFALVANPDLGLSAHLTPRGEWVDLYVTELTPTELVVRSRDPQASDTAFDFIAFGLRLGYEDQPVVRPRRADAPIPAADRWDPVYQAMPEARDATSRSRYTTMTAVALGREPVADSAEALELRRAIGEGRDLAAPKAAERQQVLGDSASTAIGGERQTERARINRESRPETTPTVPKIPAAPTPSRADSDLVARSFRPEHGGVAVAWSGDATIEPGDVVVIGRDGMRRADRTEDPTVIGIATKDAGLLFGATNEGRDAQVAVALSGIVRCKVDADFGAIEPGDLLVASSTPGHAMRREAPLPGTVVGKALEPLDAGTGTILVLVGQR